MIWQKYHIAIFFRQDHKPRSYHDSLSCWFLRLFCTLLNSTDKQIPRFKKGLAVDDDVEQVRKDARSHKNAC